MGLDAQNGGFGCSPDRRLKFLWLLLWLLGASLPASSSTVASCDEASVRAALAIGGTINFACDGRITVTNTLVVSKNTIIDASGRNVILDGGGAVSVLFIDRVSLAMTNVTVVNGGGTSQGAGLYNNGGFVSLVNCTF